MATLAGLGLSVMLAIFSDGSIQDDGLAHYLYARWAWHDAQALIDVWGRPGMTAIYALPARLGWPACRITSALLSAGTAWLAYLTARRLKLAGAGWIPLLVFAQPLFLALSFDTFTETCVAFYLALAVWLLVSGRGTWSAAAISLCFVTRYEMATLGVVWAVAMYRVSARFHAYAALAWAPVTYGLLSKAVMGRWPHEILLAGPHLTEYGQGTSLSMMVKSLVACGPAIGILALVGSVVPNPAPPIQNLKSKIQNLQVLSWLIPAVYLVHLGTQSALFWRGAFSSGGYARFFVSTAPVAAILALQAVERLRSTGSRGAWLVLAVVVGLAWLGVEIEPPPRDEVWMLVYDKVRPFVRGASAAALLAILGVAGRPRPWRGTSRFAIWTAALASIASMAGPWYFLIRPHRLTGEAQAVSSAVRWLRENQLDGAPIITTHVWTSYFLDSLKNLTALPGRNPLEGAALGSILVWDARYSPSERFKLNLERVEADPHWQQRWSSAAASDAEPFVRIYQRKD